MDEDEWARRVCLGTEGAEVATWGGMDEDEDEADEGFDFGEADTCTGFLGDVDDM